MAAPTSKELEFIERMGLFYENLGGPKTMGRIYGWLMICDPAHQAITDIASALDVSKASVSTIARQLDLAQMLERIPVQGSRQHHYRIRPGGWTQILRARAQRFQSGVDAIEFGLAVVPTERESQREMLAEFQGFLEFLSSVGSDILLARWEEFLAEKVMKPQHKSLGRMPLAAARKTDSDPPR